MNTQIQVLTSSSSFTLGNESAGSHCSRSIKTFNHEQFGSIRTMEMPDGQIGFVGKDVAMVLGYKNPSNALVAHVDEEDKTSYLIQVSGSNYKANTTFNHEQFGQIRIFQNEGKEWFCLSDVCKALSLAIPARLKERLSERGILSMNTPTNNQYGAMVMKTRLLQRGVVTIDTPTNNQYDAMVMKTRLLQRGVTTNDTPTYNQYGVR